MKNGDEMNDLRFNDLIIIRLDYKIKNKELIDI